MQNDMKTPYILGLTGGIGTGKTTVSNLFKEKGIPIIDADEISRHALDIGTSCYIKTVDHFGQSILNSDKTVNRKELAAIVFSCEDERQKLNAIIHPYVRETIFAKTEAATHEKLIVWDIPLLIEGGYQQEVDALLVVTCPTEIRIERLQRRSGLSRGEALARMQAQMSDEERCRIADFVLENGGTLDDLKEKVDAVFAELLRITDAQE